MATNINIELFKRYKPEKKLEIIESLTLAELLCTTPATITRIVKEVGLNQYKSRNKRLRIHQDRRRGNSWNSIVEGIELLKGKLYIDCYFQMDSTDTNILVPYDDFYRKGEFRGTYYATNRYGDKEPHYFIYDEGSKQRVLRSILTEYVYQKYKINEADNS